jgi:colanic acid biosynthesis glycosyl transferase WcaI
MRILYLGINYWPEDTGIAVFATGRCEYFAERGHEISAFTAFPYYPQWEVQQDYRRRLWASERRKGVRIFRGWAYIPGRVRTVRRILHEATFVASSCLNALARWPKPELIFVTSPPLALGLSAVFLSSLWKVPYVFHVADLQPDTALDLGMFGSKRVARGLYRLERLAYERAALVSTLTDAMRNKIVAKGIHPEKVELFSDWVDPSLFALPAGLSAQSWRDSVNLNGKFLVVHAGNMGVKQGLDVVLDAADLTRHDSQIVYLLVGDGAQRPFLENRARDFRLGNVLFFPLQPRETFMKLLAASDVCLVTQQRTVADVVFPSKLITLMAAARPVIASVGTQSEVARTVLVAKGGLVIPPENPRALREAVEMFRHDLPGRIRVGEKGRDYARLHWDRERTLARTEAGLLQVLNSTRNQLPANTY